eukprot:CAMPEP_0174301948 /NCGR_PEP_ID=MMETSP0809-20121228/59347_1 /TAXON_ID=73025 ORGANISM="Eutreptiella gymnastica-like, Strain CCMP1594" /NCGR_SAMPLE_ID=MMETSP0809 /ASSEMBLY_ACC=CAM_ASM_000658 /LENGTH=1066 /DNA_ID=CAMNT_0015407787 /DNA_START=39 /DNA_END=3239 /DNA_ORIENTATION=+
MASKHAASVQYLQKQGLPQFIDKMITSLVDANPDSPIDYLADWVDSMRPCHMSAVSITVVSGSRMQSAQPFKPMVMVALDRETRSTAPANSNDNPEWAENFVLPITEIDAAILQVSLLNADTSEVLGVGAVHLKPLPLMCHNVTLNVSLQMEGKEVGSVKLSLANAKPKEWMAIWGLGVQVNKAIGLIAADETGFSDPYVQLHVGDSMRQTSYKLQTLDPMWNEEFHFDINAEDADLPSLIMNVWDKDWGKDPDFLGSAVLDLNKIQPGEFWVTLQKKGRAEGTCGDLQITIKRGDERAAAVKMAAAPPKAAYSGPPKTRGLYVNILKGIDLLAMDDNGLSDPYVQVRLGPECRNSMIIEKTLNPEWNQRFIFPYDDDRSVLSIDVWDKDVEQDFLGWCSLDLKDVKHGAPLLLDVTKDNQKHGKIQLSVDKAPQSAWLPLYGLTVFVESCKDLKGQSHRLAADSYVQLEMGKQLLQTDVARMSLDPVYNHRIDLKIKTAKETLKFSVWDKVAPVPVLLGTCEVDVGALTLDGDSVQMPLEISKGGVLTGTLMVHFSPTPLTQQLKSVAKPLEHPEFLVEPLMAIRAKVVKCKGLPIMDVGGSCDAYVELVMGTALRRTQFVPDTCNPYFDEVFSIPVVDNKLVVNVWDHDDMGPELVGSAKISADKLVPASGSGHHELTLVNASAITGTVTLEIERMEMEDWLPMYGVAVTVVEASHLPAGVEPYVTLQNGSEEVVTGVCRGSRAEWNQSMPMSFTGGATLNVSVHDGSKKSCIGTATLNVYELPVAFKQAVERVVEIKDEYASQGEVTLRFQLSEPSEVAKAPKLQLVEDAPAGTQVKVHIVKANLKTEGRRNVFAQLRTGTTSYTSNTKRKTQIPIWRENCLMDWHEDEQLDITVWGRGDDGADHELLGEAQMPFFFPDDQQHAVDLSLNAAPAGQIHLQMVKANSPAGLVVQVLRCNGLVGGVGSMNRRDPYVQIVAGKEVRQTGVKFGTVDPVWIREQHTMVCTPVVEFIEFNVYHYTNFQPLLLGSGKLSVDVQGEKTVELTRQGKAAGTATVKVTHVAR